MKKLKIIILSVFAILIFGVTSDFETKADTSLEPLVIDGVNVKYYETSDNVMIPTTYIEKDVEFRGAWVATVWDIDIAYTNETQFKTAFGDLINELVANNMNAMVFQVRSQNDAYYDSDYAPWSRWVEGTEGVDPGWDIMTWMIDECHLNGIEFHAWLNPYRVANTTSDPVTHLNSLHSENWAKQNPDMVINGDTYTSSSGSTITPMILNPGEPAVKQYIRDVVTEIMTDYDVDGIHFDDYFYPSSGTSTDTITYNLYKESGQTLGDWRRENINEVIEGVKNDVDAYNLSSGDSVKFGISPSGVWASNQQIAGGSNTSPIAHDSYFTQYADSKKWVEQGWLHYISPQIYRDFQHSLIPYADIVDWWASVARGTGVDLIIGHALYMTYFDEDEISKQFLYNQKHPEIAGSLMYSSHWMDDARFQTAVSNNWTTTPSTVWNTSNVDGPDITLSGTLLENIYITDVVVTLTADNDIYYKLDGGEWILYSAPFDVVGVGAHVINTKTVDSLGEESLIYSNSIPIQYKNPDVPNIEITGAMIGSNYVVNSTLTFDSNGEDIYVAINHGSEGEFFLYTDPIVLDDTGGYFIKAKTIDSRGTDSEIKTLSITLQEACYTDPTLDITGTGNYPYFQTATITLSGEASSILYKISEGSFISYTSPFVIDTEGEFTIVIKNDDECGIEVAETITIDQTIPTEATMTITGDYDGTKYYTSETTIELATTETDAAIWVRIHNGKSWTSWGAYSNEIELLFTANYTLEYKTVDLALNESDVISQSVRLQIPPSEDNMYVVRNGEIVNHYGTSDPIILPTEYTEKTEEIRAIWFATVGYIDIKQYINEEEYKARLISALNTMEINNFNTVFFQVRPMNDAWYDSDYAPWSRYITGQEGGDPGWDVFGFFIEEAHKRGIEVHAWLNPYRVSTGTESKESQLALLHDENFAKQNPDLVIEDKSGKLILNPGERQVQVYIRNVIMELMTKYDVDGIHFDDYFYSYNGTDESMDLELYNAKKEPGQSLDDWRRENINTVVREVFEAVETYNTNNGETVMFGISPFGIWKSGGEDGSNTSPYTMQSYSDQYADTKRWVEEGWVHYILPQLYWEFDHSSAPFADLVDWWQALCAENNVDLIIGQGFYRYDDDSWDHDNELLEQLRYMTQYDSIIGSSFFTYNTLLSADTEVVQALDRLNNYYWTEYATFPWESDIVKNPDPVCTDDQTLIDGECIDNPPVCTDDQTLIDGECIDNPPVCTDDQTLIDGECVTNPPVCEDGYVLEDNECVEVPRPKTGCGSAIGIGFSFVTIFGLLGGAGLFFIRRR